MVTTTRVHEPTLTQCPLPHPHWDNFRHASSPAGCFHGVSALVNGCSMPPMTPVYALQYHTTRHTVAQQSDTQVVMLRCSICAIAQVWVGARADYSLAAVHHLLEYSNGRHSQGNSPVKGRDVLLPWPPTQTVHVQGAMNQALMGGLLTIRSNPEVRFGAFPALSRPQHLSKKGHAATCMHHQNSQVHPFCCCWHHKGNFLTTEPSMARGCHWVVSLAACCTKLCRSELQCG